MYFCFGIVKYGIDSNDKTKIGRDRMIKAKQAVVASALGLAVLDTPPLVLQNLGDSVGVSLEEM